MMSYIIKSIQTKKWLLVIDYVIDTKFSLIYTWFTGLLQNRTFKIILTILFKDLRTIKFN